MKPILLLTALAICCLSCKQSLNGTYLVYKELEELHALQMAAPTDDSRSDVEQRIKSTLMGKKFSVDFQNDYISINGKPFNNIILNKKVGYEGIEYYLGEHLYGNTTVQLRMMPNDTQYLLMAVDVKIPEGLPIIIPAQLGGPFHLDRPQKGRTIFVLKKIQ